MKVKVIRACSSNWYKVGEVYEVRDAKSYEGIGVQVWNSDSAAKHPDVIMNGDFEYVE